MKLSQDEFSNFANLPPVTKTYSKNYRQTKEPVEENDDYEKTIGKRDAQKIGDFGSFFAIHEVIF